MRGWRLIFTLACALTALPATAPAAPEAGTLQYSVPEGWKREPSGKGKSGAFDMSRGRTHFTVRPLGAALSQQDCRAKTESNRAGLAKSGKKASAPEAFKHEAGFGGFVSSVKESGGSVTYFGNFTAGNASYSFLLKRGDAARYKEAMSALVLKGAAPEKKQAAGRPKLAPVVYSTDKMSRPGPK